jgi:hypothetical protein
MAALQEWARRYIEDGYSPIPVPPGEKGPKIPDWPQLRIHKSDVRRYFNDKSNVGLILGIDGLADVDLDGPEALHVADQFLPTTGFVFGRKSRPRSHRFYRVDKPIPTRKYLDPLAKKKDKGVLLELRCITGDGEIGLQTIVPPSEHPSGERIRFYESGDPAEISSDVLVLACNYTAAAAIFVRYWPDEKSGRNEAFLGLHGTLARAGLALEDAIRLAEGIYRGLFGGEADMDQAAREAEATFKKMTAGMATTGFKRLTEFIDESVVRRALEWLGVGADAQPVYSNGGASQAMQLVAAAESAELFHTGDNETYAAVQFPSHREIWRLKDKEFKQWLAKQYYDKCGKVPASRAMNDAFTVLEGEALFKGPQHDVFVRIARLGNAIYLDLGDQFWRAVKITRSGWSVVRRPKARFRRPRGMLALPEPVVGGSILELRQFVNVGRQDDWVIVVAWLVGACQANQPFPILVVEGEQGSAKSTAAKLLRALIDPNKSPLRAQPRDMRDLMIAAQNGWIVAFDNISYLPPWLSDGLCSLATGAGLSTRELYTDTQETLFVAIRPILLNGIDGVVVRGDALDRALILKLPEIADTKRKAEKELWASFREVQPRILGALLDAIVGALRNESNVDIPALPRMADFAIWATAAEDALGWRPGTVVKAITNNRNEAKTLPLEASPITPALCAVLRTQGRFEGTATALLRKLESRNSSQKRPSGWPKSAHTLSSSLRRLAPNLRAVGIHVKFDQTPGTGSQKIIEVENHGNFCDACDAFDADGEND